MPGGLGWDSSLVAEAVLSMQRPWVLYSGEKRKGGRGKGGTSRKPDNKRANLRLEHFRVDSV